MVREYSAEFHSLSAKVRGWNECVLVDHYHNGLNPELATRALQLGNLPTLLGWIQLVCKVQSQEQMIE